MVRLATVADAGALVDIYSHYVLKTPITFEAQVPEVAVMTQRIQDVLDAGLPWLVLERGGQVLGYAYAGRWNGRCAFRFTVEISVYVDQGAVGQGIGAALYVDLLARLRAAGLGSVLAAIALPNTPSVALHEKFGFRQVGLFQAVGFKFQRWIDVGYWQLQLQG